MFLLLGFKPPGLAISVFFRGPLAPASLDLAYFLLGLAHSLGFFHCDPFLTSTIFYYGKSLIHHSMSNNQAIYSQTKHIVVTYKSELNAFRIKDCLQ